jgi:phosphohistidine phosphatase
MKQLIMVRHAKSSWDASVQTDFERPLNARGHHDAPMMAQRLIAKKIAVDAIVTSTANRALTTADYFYQAYTQAPNSPAIAWIPTPTLYHAPEDVLLATISQLPNHFQSVIVVCHNPGITDFVNILTNTRLSNMPTCGIFAINANCLTWDAFAVANKLFLFFDAPKSNGLYY